MPYRKASIAANAWKVDAVKRLRREATPAERRLLGRLQGKHRQLDARFKFQALILGYIVDFYCGIDWLAVEVDGPIHADRVAYDRQRDRALWEHGIRTLRFTNQQVLGDVDAVVASIRANIRNLSKISIAPPDLGPYPGLT